MQPLVLSLGYCRKGRLCFFAVGSPDVSVNALKKSDTAIVQWEVPSAKLAGLGSVLLLSWLLSWLSGSSLWGALLVAAGSLAKKRLPPCSDAAAAEAAAALETAPAAAGAAAPSASDVLVRTAQEASPQIAWTTTKNSQKSPTPSGGKLPAEENALAAVAELPHAAPPEKVLFAELQDELFVNLAPRRSLTRSLLSHASHQLPVLGLLAARTEPHAPSFPLRTATALEAAAKDN
eukprot:CAMPEP_0115066106 /NCGR_PEP_ID=MMETSP0227-20121206/10627_1 /TAXON_ID=89957 /ORGANISM="Polarella glacialis, Strain CCMP 1383" /LENGTH=233 /DNA_ID=CAMNT_0002451979 /DNA_START=41 /DNA_END=742 /DNA_ORIENTATION=+